MANNADVTAILYGLPLDGAQGPQSVVDHISHKLKIVIKLSRTQTVDDIKKVKFVDKIQLMVPCLKNI